MAGTVTALLATAWSPVANAATPSQAQAGECVTPHRTFFLETDYGTIGNVGVNFNGCVWQDGTSFSAQMMNQTTTLRASLAQEQIQGELNLAGTGHNYRTSNLRVIRLLCIPIVNWVAGQGPCAQADEWDYTLSINHNTFTNTMSLDTLTKTNKPAGWFETLNWPLDPPYTQERTTTP
ncbi:hypothetical protein [Streptomyces sp. NL15-2K]|uniref:hypothetical protein n=1 Tax=Streptomyces sp. NL15-2K TaxID=376149 RepID=UPI000F56662E|nr:hypothetical protein [Streptomyces sp. NL15-2K]